MPKLCPNIRFPHQQDFFPIRSVTKSSTSRFSHENLVEKFKIFGQDFVTIRTALLYKRVLFFLEICQISRKFPRSDKNKNTRFLNAIRQILKSNFPRFKRSSAMLKIIL